MTSFLLNYYSQHQLLFEYFDFLRDVLIALQIIMVIFFLLSSRKLKNLIYYSLIFVLAFLLAILFETYFPSPRPIGGLDSFPSRHTLISTALSFGLIYQDLKWGIFSFVITFLIGLLSLISLRHWLIDIIFGFIFGFLLFVIIQKFLNFFDRFDINKSQNKT
jgi:membrane-associated phospholipid phosphatase